MKTDPAETHREFWRKYALPPLARPSCIVCGWLPEQWPPAIQHAELPGIVVCHRCRDAAQRALTDDNGERCMFDGIRPRYCEDQRCVRSGKCTGREKQRASDTTGAGQ